MAGKAKKKQTKTGKAKKKQAQLRPAARLDQAPVASAKQVESRKPESRAQAMPVNDLGLELKRIGLVSTIVLVILVATFLLL